MVEVNYEDKINPMELNISNELVYIVQAELYPLKFCVTFKNVSAWGGLLVKAFGNLSDCRLDIDGKTSNHALYYNINQFYGQLQNHVIENIKH